MQTIVIVERWVPQTMSHGREQVMRFVSPVLLAALLAILVACDGRYRVSGYVNYQHSWPVYGPPPMIYHQPPPRLIIVPTGRYFIPVGRRCVDPWGRVCPC